MANAVSDTGSICRVKQLPQLKFADLMSAMAISKAKQLLPLITAAVTIAFFVSPVAHAVGGYAASCETQFMYLSEHVGFTHEDPLCVRKCQKAIADLGDELWLGCGNHCASWCGEPSYWEILMREHANPAEWELIRWYPWTALQVAYAATAAAQEVARYPELAVNRGYSDKADALRHFLWSALATAAVGEHRARWFLDAHEYRPNVPSGATLSKSQAARERRFVKLATDMDQHNNAVGIAVARELKLRGEQITIERLVHLGLAGLKSASQEALARDDAAAAESSTKHSAWNDLPSKESVWPNLKTLCPDFEKKLDKFICRFAERAER